MSLSFSVDGKPLAVSRVSTGALPGGPIWATLDIPYSSVMLRPHDRVEVCDDGKPVWVGVVESTTSHLTGQEVQISELTSHVMSRRITSTGDPDPHFRYGDVIRYRDRSMAVNDDRYMVVKRRPGTTDEYEVIGLTGRGRGQGFDIGEADWELAE